MSAVEAGSFYCLIGRHTSSLPHWLQFGRSADRAVEKRFHALIRSESLKSSTSSRGWEYGTEPASPGGSQSACGEPQTITFPGVGLRVQQSLEEVSGVGLFRKTPHVYATKNAVVVFYGFLSNADELAERLVPSGVFRPGSFDDPSELAAATAAAGGLLGGGRDGRQVDHGRLAAEIISRLYEKHDDSSLLLLLSELQGEYAFLVYDSDRRQVFAARDPSGRERMYYRLGDDDAPLALASHPSHVPESLAAAAAAMPELPSSPRAAGGCGDASAAAAACAGGWREVPPGHYLSGRPPRVRQFALTPEQLSFREYLESVEDEMPAAVAAAAVAAGCNTVPTNITEFVKHGSHRSSQSDCELFPVDY